MAESLRVSLASEPLALGALDGRYRAAVAPLVDYLSEAALPMLKLPRQRLQLREEGAAGKVLIRRLPNADVAKLGKERGRDGRSMIVAEIYIHQ